MNARTIRNLFLIFSICLAMTMNIKESRATVLAPHLYKSVLENGLTLLVKETPGTKAATVQIWVKAGSIYEEEKEGGITHLIEHMIFKGTPTRDPGEIAGAIEELGGRINAYTSYEYTVYHATLSSRNWGTALEILTDAILHSTFDPDELEREKKVVLEEIGMRYDRPSIKLYQEMMSTAYTTHPYRLPIIGTEESVSSFTRDNILHYMKKHYQARNLAVVVAGDVQFEPALQKVKSLFGELPLGEYEQPLLPNEPARKTPRLFVLHDDVNQSHMNITFPITAFSDPDTPILDVIAGIMGQGETSRLYHQLRDEKRLVYRINASAFTPHDPGLMEIMATLEYGRIVPALEAALEEFFKLKYLPVEEEELERVKRNVESDFIFHMERVEGQARVMGTFEFLAGDPRENDYLDKVRAVSKEDVQRIAAKYFSGNTITAGLLLPHDADADLTTAKFKKIIAKAESAAKKAVPASQISAAYLSNVHRFTLANGLTLLVREESNTPTVAVRVVFPGGLRGETESTNGAFAFINELLPKGTEKMSARDLALKIANMAGEIQGFNGKNTFGLKADFLSRFFEEGLELVRDIIIRPAFDPQEAEKIRPELLDHLKHQEDSLSSLAFREFNRLLFQGHPYSLNTAGSKTAIQKFTVEELKDLYKKHANPDRMVLAVAGDVKAEDVREIVAQLFEEWAIPERPGDTIEEEEYLPPTAPPSPEIFRIRRDKEQVHIIIGFLGSTLTSPDRYGLEVLDTVFSGQSGRLFTELRDKKSLAYSLSSFSLLGIDTGSIGVYIATNPDKKDETISALWKEIHRIREEPITVAELKKAKNILIGNYELGLQTHGSQAMEMSLNETYGLGQDFGNRYIDAVSRVTAEDVLKAARKYLHPDHYVLITVGADAPASADGNEAESSAKENE